ncbi:MAG: carbon storage regulator CsrA [Thermoguttaceae bacterium]|nr:carbon storage regulator CsrA [Thermoguttaceae bacterium]
MLVLSRYKDQSIYIGDDVVVTIVDVRGDRIRLGIEAPPNVPVHRQEIYEAIQRENAAADGGELVGAFAGENGARERTSADFEMRLQR